ELGGGKMAADIVALLKSLLNESAELVSKEAAALFEEIKSDGSEFALRLADRTKKFISMLAEEKITKDEFEELMGDQIELARAQANKLQSDAKVSAQKIIDGVKDLTLNK